jgi:aspartyl-tRNA(Asn)/glutamyl-tRNA(Gln) amidotransferase subunit A
MVGTTAFSYKSRKCYQGEDINMMTEPYKLSLADAVNDIKSGRLSPVTLAQSILLRIEALEPNLNAWITLRSEQVLEEALKLETEIGRGDYRGPLHGIPIGIKDIFYTAGIKTTAASSLYADFIPVYDATTVRRLKEAGAIILGKTMTTEFANSDPSPAVNPWNPSHTAGGSSSGSCVAVSSGMCPVALGSQTAGSVLRPAAYNGIVGFKPTYGRVSRHGVIPVSWSLDTVGILVRKVEDAAIMLDVLAGYDPKDSSSSPEPKDNYWQAIQSTENPPTIGLLKDYFYDHCTKEVQSHTEDAAQRLAKAGARIEEVSLPKSFTSVRAAHSIILNVECAAFHQDMFRRHWHDYGPKLRQTIETGMLIPGVQYLHSQRIRRALTRDMDDLARRFDAILTPCTPSEAPRDITTTGNPVLQSPWTFTGLPTITIPSGLARSGLPLGIQMASPSFYEADLLRVANWCERTLGVSIEPPYLNVKTTT